MKKGWEIKKLGEVCEFENGDRGVNYPSKAHRTETGLPFINAGHLTSDGLDLDSMDYISRERYNLLGSGKIKKGDILFCLRGSLGKFAKIQEFSEGAIASSLVIVRPKLKVTSDFVMHYFESKICSDMIADFGNGAAQPNLSAGSLKNFEIPLPSLPEQQRIVVILNEVFEAIAKAKANAEQNLRNSKELFESYLQNVFETKGEGWEEKNFEDCFKLKSGDGLTSKNMSENGEYPVFGGNGIAGLHNNFNLSGSNIIIGRVGALCGNVRHITENIWLTDNAFKVVGLKFDYDHSFLTYLLNYKNLRSFARQAAQPVISNSSLKNVALEFPKSLKEQQNIAQKLDVLLLETKKLEAIYKQKINDLEELKKSVLQKAFAGELKEDLKEHFAENA